MYPAAQELGGWPEFPGFFAVGARPWLDLLREIAHLEGEETTRLAGFSTPRRATVQHLLLAEALGLVLLERRTLLVRPAARQPLLRGLWSAGDVEGLSRLMSPFRRYRSLVEAPPGGTERLPLRERSLLSLAKSLGDVAVARGRPVPGVANPTLAEIRERVLGALERLGGLAPESLLEQVFLGELGVTPARALRAWGRMLEAGVFEGLEFRRRPAGGPRVEVLRIDRSGWRLEKVELAALGEIVPRHRS